jgi:glutamate carboxypeptidase
METLLRSAKKGQRKLISLLRQLVECESPSDDAAAVTRFMEMLADGLAGQARTRMIRGGGRGAHLLCEFLLPGARRRGPQIMALGHGDTVWPVGTLRGMPFREADGRIYGPGIFDMKAGLAMFIHAMRLLRELDCPVPAKVLLQVNSDEEVGSDSSRPLTEKEALRSRAVLVLEPALGPAGSVKTARKGVGDYRVRVTGVAAHAGIEHSAGANAIVELARQVERISAFTDLEKGITVNAGVIRGGTRPNVVPEEAVLDVDVRIARLRDAAGIEKKFQSLRPINRRCLIAVSGGLNRPPMERTKGVVALYRTARKLSARMGIELGEGSTGGGSDGNFTGGLGVPTLDGLGAVGEGAHATHEHIVANRIADRTALLAGLVRELANSEAFGRE